MSGWILVAMGLVISAADVAVGLYFLRQGTDLTAPRSRSRQPSPEQASRLGRIILLASPLPLFVLAALAFGLFGPIDGIETVRLGISG